MLIAATLSNLTRFRSNKKAPALLVLIAGTGGLAQAYWIRAALVTRTPETAAVSQPVQQQNALEAQRITLRATGFEPAEVTRPAGRFLLAINDRSGQRDTSFSLLRGTGERLRQVRLSDTPRKHEWREVVNLLPGRYVLVDNGNRERVCHILLTN